MTNRVLITESPEGTEVLSAVINGDPYMTDSSRTNFQKILEKIARREELLPEDFNEAVKIAQRFSQITDRVSMVGETLYFDGDEVHNTLTEQVVRYMNDGVPEDDWRCLVLFWEKIATNPDPHSRENLFRWLDAHSFTITQDGDILGYKGVKKVGEGQYESITHGPAIVDGLAVDGAVPNNVGSTVEMARSSVTHDPNVACSVGLHVGTHNYAKSFAKGAVLEVVVNPRDVVSVPTDCGGQKMRVSKYRVLGVNEIERTDAVYHYNSTTVEDDDYDDDDYDEEDYCDCDCDDCMYCG